MLKTWFIAEGDINIEAQIGRQQGQGVKWENCYGSASCHLLFFGILGWKKNWAHI